MGGGVGAAVPSGPWCSLLCDQHPSFTGCGSLGLGAGDWCILAESQRGSSRDLYQRGFALGHPPAPSSPSGLLQVLLLVPRLQQLCACCG